MRSQAGVGRFGCLVTAIVFVIALFLCFKVLPLYLDKINLGDEMAQIVNRAGAEDWKDRTIREHLMSTVRGEGFEISPKDIEIVRGAPGKIGRTLLVKVSYRRAVDFPGYIHVFELKSEMSALMGSLK
jgi:hypothetical protein